jgi:hypothetical protein
MTARTSSYRDTELAGKPPARRRAAALPRQGAEPAAVPLVLLRDHTHAGTAYAAGASLEVDAASAQYLIRKGVAAAA